MNRKGGSISIRTLGQFESEGWVILNRTPGSNCIGIIIMKIYPDFFRCSVCGNLIGKIEPKPIVVNAEPPRSSTSSPGISKDGKVMSSKEIGKLLAKRMNKN